MSTRRPGMCCVDCPNEPDGCEWGRCEVWVDGTNMPRLPVETRPAKYRKKPVVIEAMRLTPETVEACIEFCEGNLAAHPMIGVVIRTLEGDHLASNGDYIIKGAQGELYPCKPDIFDATYEPAETAANVAPSLRSIRCPVCSDLMLVEGDGNGHPCQECADEPA